MADKLRVGLVGCGRIAQFFHVKILSQSSSVDLVALAEADPHRLEEARVRAPAAALFSDYRELLEREDVEAVVICLPTGMHAEAATAAFDRGKHVYLEKPIATNASDAKNVVEAWQRSGKVGMIGFNYRFDPLYQQIKRRIAGGEIGELVGARSAFCGAARDVPAWKARRETGGGVLLDLASHHIDLSRFLFGQEIREASAMVRSVRSEEDTASLEMRLVDGLLVQSFYSMSAVEEGRFEVYGTKGMLAVDRYLMTKPEWTPPKRAYGRLERLQRGLGSLGKSSRQLRKVLMPQTEPSYEAALCSFVDAVLRGQPVIADMMDGYRSLAVILAAEESARSGRVVSIAVD